MTNSKTTKKALLSSILALTMCVAMLIATTFAWFTDTASTGVNKIESGTLDVDIVDESGTSLNGETLVWQKATEGKDQTVLWEPGVTYNLQSFKIVNKGSLALKYEITINGITGDAKLLDAIKFKATIAKKSGEGSEECTLDNLNGSILPAGASVTTDTDEVAGETGLITISGHMDENAGNEYQGLSIDGVGITVTATQYTYESDSESNQYDKDAPTYKASSTEAAQALLDSISGNAVIELAAGDYETLYLRQTQDSSTRRTDLDVDVTNYPAYYRDFNNVTIKAADNAAVNCKGIKAEAGLFWYNSAPASNNNDMHMNSGFISYLSLKNISIEGITFNETRQNAIVLRDNANGNNNGNNKGSTLYVNGFAVKNCKGTGDISNSEVHFFSAGSGAADATFCGIENGVKGLNNITITGCEMSNYNQAIAFNNDVATLNNLTVSGNTFTGCTGNNVQITNKVNKGLFTFSNNTLVNMSGRFVRLANATADAVITVDNTTVTNPTSYEVDVKDAGEIFKVTGTAGFKVTSNGNSGWTVKTNTNETWVANGNMLLLPAGE